MRNGIHKRLIKRLFWGWVALSLGIGTGVYFFEVNKLEHLVVGLAIEESTVFTREVHLADRGEAVYPLLKRQADAFLKGHFIIVELYDGNDREILRAVNPEKLERVRLFESAATPALGGEGIRFRSVLAGRNLFMQVRLPLLGDEGRLVGYFQGAYEVGKATMRNIEEDIIVSLLFVVVVIFLTAAMLYPIIISLNSGLIRLSADLLRGNVELMDVLGSAIAKRDSDTNSHNYRVTLYAIRLGEALKLDNAQIGKLIAGSFLHDVGKIGIRDSILLKEDRLNEAEMQAMRSHVSLGVDIISKSQWLLGAKDVVAYHHERFDGTGYLQGLSGKDIPINARIFSIVDVFDALTSRRPYKHPIGFDETMRMIRLDSGRRFDPELVAVFDKLAPSLYQEISHASDDELRSMLSQSIRTHLFG